MGGRHSAHYYRPSAQRCNKYVLYFGQLKSYPSFLSKKKKKKDSMISLSKLSTFMRVKVRRNTMPTTLSQQILCDRLLLMGKKKNLIVDSN